MGDTTSASVLLAAWASSRALRSNQAGWAVYFTGPNSSTLAPSRPVGVMVGQPSVAGLAGGYSPGSTWACMSIRGMALPPAWVDRHVHRGLALGLAGQRLDSVRHIRQPEAVG